ncbi:hypothetical protein [Mycobacterium sp.]|uniref:hypothetical protein n=1 Tax=Mycobacterium sp. TaxID=1785 RepID=UPI00262DF724|nr:hypothetical protein [Mycobacterium sp.]
MPSYRVTINPHHIGRFTIPGGTLRASGVDKQAAMTQAVRWWHIDHRVPALKSYVRQTLLRTSAEEVVDPRAEMLREQRLRDEKRRRAKLNGR